MNRNKKIKKERNKKYADMGKLISHKHFIFLDGFLNSYRIFYKKGIYKLVIISYELGTQKETKDFESYQDCIEFLKMKGLIK